MSRHRSSGIVQRNAGPHARRVIRSLMPLKAIGDGLFGELVGRGEPRVLALHGWGRSRSDFTAVLNEVPGLAVDLPGFGASPPPNRAMGAYGYAKILKSALTVFDVPPVIVGHSFGGRVAVAIEAIDPGSSRALVLAGAPLVKTVRRRERPALGYRLIRTAHRLRLVSKATLERARGRYGSADYRSSSGVMREVLVIAVNETYESEMGGLMCPVELVWGENDLEVPVEAAHAAVDAMASTSAGLTVLPGVGHQVPVEAPEALAGAIRSLL